MGTMAKNKAIHPVVKRLRKLRGKRPQEAFAKLLGISLSTLRKWEQGATSPDPSTARFIELWLESQEK